jgi:hypothetical protein
MVGDDSQGSFMLTLLEFTTFPLIVLFDTFFSVLSNTASALSIPFSCRNRCARVKRFDFDFFEMPELCCVDRTERSAFGDSGRGRDVRDLSRSRDGEIARLEARERTDCAGEEGLV